MEKSLFEQAKEMMNNVTNSENVQSQDRQAVQNAIQAAYREATPEEQTQLRQLEKQLNEKMH